MGLEERKSTIALKTYVDDCGGRAAHLDIARGPSDRQCHRARGVACTGIAPPQRACLPRSRSSATASLPFFAQESGVTHRPTTR